MFGIQEENVPGGHTRTIKKSEGASELLNTLEESLCRESIARVTKYSVSFARSALSRKFPGGLQDPFGE
jgi:hypothetical protein